MVFDLSSRCLGCSWN